MTRPHDISRPDPTPEHEHGEHLSHPHYEAAAPSDWMGGRAVKVMLSDLDFPLTKEKLMELSGVWDVPLTRPQNRVKMGELLKRLDDRRYRSPDDVAKAIARAWPELRE